MSGSHELDTAQLQKNIDFKKKQLDELKKKKEQRARDLLTMTSPTSPQSSTRPPVSSFQTPPPSVSSSSSSTISNGSLNSSSVTGGKPIVGPKAGADLLADVNNLLSRPVTEHKATFSPSLFTSSSSSFGTTPFSATIRPPPTLSTQHLPNQDYPAVEILTYEQSIQVNLMEDSKDKEILKDYDNLKIVEHQLRTELVALQEFQKKHQNLQDLEDAKREIKELTPSEEKKILESNEFQAFFTKTSKMVERAIGQNNDYDVTVDYAAEDKSESDRNKVQEHLVKRFSFSDPNQTANRPVTSMSWSPKHKELLLASYAGQEDVLSPNPDGLVLVWSLHMTQRPEYYFTHQSAVLSAQFHPSDPKLIFGGTQSGQLIMWDTRAKSTPVNRSSLSRGHTHPIFALSIVPSVNMLHNIVSVSSDGQLCVWGDDNLHEPTSEIYLRHGKEEKKEECTTNSFDFPGREYGSVVLGSDEGNLYKAKIHDKPGVYEDINRAHDAPITQVMFHPINKVSPSNTSELYLTSSYDWTVKLWSHKTNRPLYTFESAKDYVYDVQWSPVHPALFASGDGTGKIDLWNINHDTEVPLHTVNINQTNDAKAHGGAEEKHGYGAAVSRLRWDEDGRHLAVGSSVGTVDVYDVAESVGQPTKEDVPNFWKKVKGSK